MQCANLVTDNDLWSPIPYLECGNLVTGFPHMYNMITINDLWPPIPYIECRNLVTGCGGPCNWVPPHVQYDNCQTYGPPKPYIECEGPPHVWIWFFQDNAMWEPCNCQCLMVPHTLYGIWKPCNLVSQHLQYDFFRTMQCGNLVTVNVLWSPIPYMEYGNHVTWSPNIYNTIFSGQCNVVTL